MGVRWTEEQKRALVRLWPTHSAKQIGAILGIPSRSAINGKAARMGLPSKVDITKRAVAHAVKTEDAPEHRPGLTMPWQPGTPNPYRLKNTR